jgi:hypothetical protein
LFCAGQRIEIAFGFQKQSSNDGVRHDPQSLPHRRNAARNFSDGHKPCRADVDIDINIGFGGGFLGKVSCRTGERIVERRFNRVSARDCRGSHYEYIGRSNGKWYYLTMNSRTARITNVRRWWR